MISIFDDAGNRLPVAWNGVNFNNAVVRTAPVGGLTQELYGAVLDNVAFSTPISFASEPIMDITKGGGGLEYQNPLINTRILSLQGRLQAAKESDLNLLIRNFLEAFHPMYLQSEKGLSRAGTLTWPPPTGTPRWVHNLPLTFNRQMPRSYSAAAFPDGIMDLQYFVAPLAVPNIVKADVLTGVGVQYTAEFVLFFGGQSFGQTLITLTGDGATAWTWGQAVVWPTFQIVTAGAGAANYTITTTGTTMATSLVLNLSGVAAGHTIFVDTWDHTIYDNDTITDALYSSGDFPVLYGGGNTTVAYTNTTNMTSSMLYRQSDWM